MLVNNAGYLGGCRPFEQFEPEEWQRILQVNLVGVFEVTRQVYCRSCVGQERGASSIWAPLRGKEGLPNLAAYSPASAGVIAFTKALAREVSDSEIRVNCVAPGPIDTDLIRRLGNEVGDGIAGLVLWLCSDASAFNTGAVFDMSGGRARY